MSKGGEAEDHALNSRPPPIGLRTLEASCPLNLTMQYSPVATQFGPPASAREQWPHLSDPASSESEAGDRKHLDYL